MAGQPQGMAYATEPTAAGVYGAADRFVGRALRTGGNLFQGAKVWTAPVLDDLHARLADGLAPKSEGDRQTFGQRWDTQLGGAPDTTVQLAGELLFVHVLFAADLTAKTKRDLVYGTLTRASAPATVPHDLDQALESGLARTGIAFKTRRQCQLCLLLDAVRTWRDLRAPMRRTLLDDPWAFKAWLFALPHDGAHAQREALLHLVHPATFEPIVSPKMKTRIVQAFAENVPADVSDVDEALIWIREALTEDHGEGFWFTAPGLVEHWRP